jgi:NAD(P)H dehydrogenase (quinone)
VLIGDMTPIGVTGATGRLGGRVARLLATRGVPQRLVVRDPSRAPQLPGADLAVAAYRDGSAVARALDGLQTVLMVSGAETPDRVVEHRTFVDAAVAAGGPHLVYVSFYAAAPDATFTLARDHWATEQWIRASGLDHTFLRDNLYADFLPAMIGEDGVIRGPAGEGRVSVVAQDDIAEVAAAILQAPDAHAGATYRLTGPAAVTLAQAAAVISAATGREVGYQAETVAQAYASRARYGAPDWQLDAWVSTYTAIASGELDGVSDDVPRITGHPATSLEDLMRQGAGQAVRPHG